MMPYQYLPQQYYERVLCLEFFIIAGDMPGPRRRSPSPLRLENVLGPEPNYHTNDSDSDDLIPVHDSDSESESPYWNGWSDDEMVPSPDRKRGRDTEDNMNMEDNKPGPKRRRRRLIVRRGPVEPWEESPARSGQ
jgi:hypothetical protein